MRLSEDPSPVNSCSDEKLSSWYVLAILECIGLLMEMHLRVYGDPRTRLMILARHCSKYSSAPSPQDTRTDHPNPKPSQPSYAISELQADVERELALLPESEREAQRTQFGIFVVHNKRKPKLASLPADIPCVPSLFRCLRNTISRRKLRLASGRELTTFAFVRDTQVLCRGRSR